MKWMKNHKLIVFLITIVVASLLVVMISVNTGGQNRSVTNKFNTVATAIEKPFVSLADAISNNLSGVFSYKRYQKENEELKKENAELKKQITATSLSAKELQELRELAAAVNYNLKDAENGLVTADITTTAMYGASWMNSFTIDRGTESGIKNGNIVVYGSGLVGKVVSTGHNWSKVISITDAENKASFSVVGKLDLVGVVEDAKNGILNGFMLDNKANVEEGDILITSGLGIYPAGLEIGKVTKLKYDSDSQLLRIKVKPSVNFRTLQKVSVII